MSTPGEPREFRATEGATERQASMGLDRSPTEELRLRQRADGAWGARRGLPGSVEPTALATLALSMSSQPAARSAADRAGGWLRRLQRLDGSWPHSRAVPGSSWMTSLAVLALAPGSGPEPAALSGARWLLGQEGQTPPWHVRLLAFLRGEEPAVELDATLIGWPWVEGTFSWVEPTAWAMLALKRTGEALPQEAVRRRIAAGERMLLDRMCPGGGWNYGNSRVLGEALEPYPDTTALALIALQRTPGPEVEGAVTTSLDALGRMLERNDSALTLSLSILALQLHRKEVEGLRARLATRVHEGRMGPDTRSLALAALALNPTASPFRVAPPADIAIRGPAAGIVT